MLREILETKQKPGEPRKRWFASLDMDLFVWFDEANEIISYQLTYDKPHGEKALVWSKENGFSHHGVDDGSRPGKYPRSPLFVDDGLVVPARIISLLKNDGGDLEPSIEAFIVAGVRANFES